MKKIIFFQLAWLILLTFTGVALADGPQPVKLSVVTAQLNVRMGPNDSTPVLTQLKQGDIVEVVSQNSKSGWWLIRLPDGQTGWVSGSSDLTQAQPADPNTPPPNSTAITVTVKIRQPSSQRLYVAAAQLNVRVGPGVGYPEIAQLNQGQIIPAIEQNPATGWWLVRLPDNRTGWVSNDPGLTRSFEANHYAPIPINPTGTVIIQPHSGGPIYAVEGAALNGSTPPQLRYLDTGIDPALSPDGTKLAYTTYHGVNGGTFASETGALWVMDLKTGEKRAILGEMYEPKAPTWSPDGKEIILNHQKGGRQTEERRCYSKDDAIDQTPGNAFDVHRSGDGSVCFKMQADLHWQLRKVTVETGQFQDLPAEEYSFGPTWDPANSWRVVFYTPASGLIQLDLNRGVYFPFFSLPAKMFKPVFSPDGRKVAVTFWLHDHWEIYTVDAASGDLTRLTTGHPYNERTSGSAAPAWSPDGKQLLFLTNRSGQWQPWIMDADGSNARPFLPPETSGNLQFAYNGVHEQLFSWR
ncbi:MAG: SH3 domain-containing protein [Anaerolineales bacterium]|nr:SH3 domain-containing protein [Anaerolineales bacterium]